MRIYPLLDSFPGGTPLVFPDAGLDDGADSESVIAVVECRASLQLLGLRRLTAARFDSDSLP